MNVEPNLALLSELKVFPAGDEKTGSIYRGSLQHLDLQIVDYMMIRDLASFSDASDDALHVLLISMCMSLNEGSLCLNLERETLTHQIRRFVGDTAEDYTEKIIGNIKRNKYPTLVSTGMSDFMPLIYYDGTLFFQKYLRNKLSLEGVIDGFLSKHSVALPVTLPEVRKSLRQVLIDHPVLLEGKPIVFNDGQKLSLAVSLLKNFVVISGGPGTGKTSVIIAILRSFIRCGVPAHRICLAAPTGRAARRMTESVQSGLQTIVSGEAGSIDKELLTIGASTVHRLLGYHPARDKFTYNRNNRLPADVLIVDEISMVDVVLMTRLMASVGEDTRVIFLGDKNQLPSVDAGTVLADFIPESEKESRLCYSLSFGKKVNEILPELNVPICEETNSMTDRIVVLTESYRSGKIIQKIADTIIQRRSRGDAFSEVLKMMSVIHPEDNRQKSYGAQGRFPRLSIKWPGPEDRHPGSQGHHGSCRLISGDEEDIKYVVGAFEKEHESTYWRGILHSWLEHAYLKPGSGRHISYEDLVKQVVEIDFLSLLEADNAAGPLGALFNSINDSRILTLVRKSRFGCIWINRFAGELLKPVFDPDCSGSFFHGMPILMTSNDYTRDLYNGDVGIVLRGKGREYRAVFQRVDGYVSYPLDFLPAWEPAFSITVHKSQGSEYGQVLLVLPEDRNNRLLTREMIYTGLTRARFLAVIYGKKNVLKRAVEQRIARESGIRVWAEG